MTEYILMTSTGKTGTQTFGRMLGDLNPNTISIWEPVRIADALMKKVWAGESEEEIVAFVKHHHTIRFPKNPKIKYYIECNCFTSFYMNYFIKAFPDSKVIWVTRDGRDVVSSNYIGLNMLDDAFWSEYLKRTDEDYKGWTNLMFWCWRWGHVEEMIEEHLKDHPKVLHLKFEDIFGNDHTDLKRLQEFIGPDFVVEGLLDRRLNRTNDKKRRIGKHNTWTKSTREIFDRMAHDMMVRRGYYEAQENINTPQPQVIKVKPMGKTKIEMDIDELKAAIANIQVGGVDKEALKAEILASVPKVEAGELPAIDVEALKADIIAAIPQPEVAEAPVIDTEALKAEIIAGIPVSEGAPPVDVAPVLEEAKSYTDGCITHLNERYNVDAVSLEEKFNAINERLELLTAEITLLKEHPAIKVIEDEVVEPEQPPQ